VGAALAFGFLHDPKSKVPRSCVATSFGGAVALAVAAAHHVKGSHNAPHWYCAAGLLGAGSAVAWGIHQHRASETLSGATPTPMPMLCWVSTLAAVGAAVAATLLYNKK